MVWLQIIALLLTVLTSVYLFFLAKFNYWKNVGIPFAEPIFPRGSLKGVGVKFHRSEVIDKYYKQFKDKSPFFGMYFMINPVAFITDLDLIKSVLVKDSHNFLNKGNFYNEKDDPLSAHLFNIDNPKWKSLRTKLTPTFTSGKMKMMFGTIVDVANKFIDTLENESRNNKEYEIKDILARFTTDVIGSCAFGLDISSLEDPHSEFREMGKKTFDLPLSIKTIFMFNFKELAKKLGMKFILEDVAEFFMKVVKDTVEYREKENVVRPDFMNLLIQMKNNGEIESDTEPGKKIKTGKLTLEEIGAQAFVFFLAGFETSSTAMTYCLYELALNEEIQEKARKNVLQILKKHNGQFTYEAVMEMTYVEQCLNESLRKYPPLTDVNRVAKEDYKVEGTKFVIEKGTKVFIPSMSIQHDPEYYPDPEKFDPERFTPEEISKRNAYTFLSFGSGPRACIGLRFGMLQAKIGMALLLKNFKIDRCDKTIIPLEFLKHTFILTPAGGVFINIKKIE